MKILVACEESQALTNEFRKLGQEAFSCDVQKCSGGHEEWHIQQDVLPLLNGRCSFVTMDGAEYKIESKWDMIIAFPPCTHLAVSGARHFKKKRENGKQEKAIEFFCQFFNVDCDKVAIENPLNIINGKYIEEYFPKLAEKYNLPKEPTQRVQPYWFGDNKKKKTCLWLKGLPKLEPTNIVEPSLVTYHYKNKDVTVWNKINKGTRKDRQKERSKLSLGMAKAMAEQWGVE